MSKSYTRNQNNYPSHQIQKKEQYPSPDDSLQLLPASTQPPSTSNKYHSSLLNSKQNPTHPVIHDSSHSLSPHSVQASSQDSSQSSRSNGANAPTPGSEKCSNSDTNDSDLATNSHQTISATQPDVLLPECYDKGTIPKPTPANYENVVPLKSDSIPPLPPRSINKPPLYENVLIEKSQTEVSKSSAPSNSDQQSNQAPSSVAQQPTAIENQRRFG